LAIARVVAIHYKDTQGHKGQFHGSLTSTAIGSHQMEITQGVFIELKAFHLNFLETFFARAIALNSLIVLANIGSFSDEYNKSRTASKFGRR
jgi:hypothetical protein